MRAVALLRGVNVGGVRIRMTDLTAGLTEDGFTEVRTVLASGNVVLTGPDDPGAAATRVSAVIRERFGFDVATIAVGLDVVRAAIDGYPFPRGEDRHAYAVFADQPSVLAELLEQGDPDPAVERVQRGADVLYWDVPKGMTLGSAFGKRLAARQAAGAVTTRNIRTLEKIVAVG